MQIAECEKLNVIPHSAFRIQHSKKYYLCRKMIKLCQY